MSEFLRLLLNSNLFICMHAIHIDVYIYYIQAYQTTFLYKIAYNTIRLYLIRSCINF